MRFVFALIALLLAVPAGAATHLDRLTLPPGFHIALYSDQVPNARELALGTNGTVFAGSRDAGKVYALTDRDGDGRADQVRVVASGLKLPVGVAFHHGNLYVSAVSRIYVLRDIEQHLDDPPQPQLVTDKLPDDLHHGWKFIAFGPDGKLYVPEGAPCNICLPDKQHAKLMRMDADGSHWQDVAYGIRNTVGFDWQPGTHTLYFTDNGRDMMGDDVPSDELNRVDHRGQHFGYPFCHQGDVPDPEYGKGHPCSRYTPPVLKLGAHVAALGMRFYTGTMFPAAYRGAILIAEHGSWNRSTKSGYRVMAVHMHGRKVGAYTPLVTGFEQHESAWGRPADVLVLKDGSVLVSDDLAGAIYRITYRSPDA
ncbi:PQQ-dependent sugar dehydrogenase [Oleiagrimonas sp. C23AA]|uniref:PQQ-dependent sugar dehydrogenase n=1 Tax=Oleiagrimonas sp. C23AA TaxID=2719047 RepID=UPI00141FDD04|nr:PQQ-dependent sugar dehydrogenase [Oleiagrimonas sp. C23AA]NII10630.1 sorbosone dehydrogenase family protein [Oleiagrimonas sp. C23AA]